VDCPIKGCPIKGCPIKGVVIASAGIAGLAGLNWPTAALAGALVFVLIELSTRGAPPERLANWQIGPWRPLAGASLIAPANAVLDGVLERASDCCLGKLAIRPVGTAAQAALASTYYA